MSEAFKRHVPMWIILVAAFILALILVINRPVSNPATDLEDKDDIGGITHPKISLETAAEGFSAPVDIFSTGFEGDQRLFIVEQGGRILSTRGNGSESNLLLDITDQVIFEGEQGLLGATFHPNLSDNPYIYINYTRPTNNGRETVIARYDVNGDQTVFDANSQKIILTQPQPYANHNGGDLAFGPDGYLYIALGDGGSGGDPQNFAQNPSSWLGKILRINVDTSEPYAVPEDNPFVADENYRSEIWSLGLRNPWRISFDPKVGDMWIGDVGQKEIEEINHEPANTGGRNYGWRCWEGGHEYDQSGCKDGGEYTFPVAQYEHEGERCSGSVTGGYVYHGQDYPSMRGWYFYADYCKSRIYALDSYRPTISAGLLTEGNYGISTFGVDSRGELYAADATSGIIYRLVTE